VQLCVLPAQSLPVQCAQYDRQDHIELERLEDVIECAALHGFHCRIDGAVARHHDRTERRVHAFCGVEEGDAVHLRHHEVRQQQIEIARSQRCQGLPA